MEKEKVELSVVQRAWLRLFGCVKVGRERRNGWSGEMDIYAVNCGRHGVFLDYRHGYDNHFTCMECWEESKC